MVSIPHRLELPPEAFQTQRSFFASRTPDPESRPRDRYRIDRHKVLSMRGTDSKEESPPLGESLNRRACMIRLPLTSRLASSSPLIPSGDSPWTNSTLWERQRDNSVLASASTATSDPLREALRSGKEFVPTAHLGADAFPQFPSIRQTPSSPLFLIDWTSTTEIDRARDPSREALREVRREEVSLWDVIYKICLLVRAILLEYRYIWISFAIAMVGFRYIYYIGRIAIVPAVFLLGWPHIWHTFRALVFSVLPPVPIPRLQLPPPSKLVPKQRIRDLPQNQPSAEQAQPPTAQPTAAVDTPPWLRYSPIGRFGEKESGTLRLENVSQLSFLERKANAFAGEDVAAIKLMVQKLKAFIMEVCSNRLLLSKVPLYGPNSTVQIPLITFNCVLSALQSSSVDRNS